MNWIWPDDTTHQHETFTNTTISWSKDLSNYPFCVCEFEKRYSFNKSVKELNILVSADVFYHLFINGEFTGIGPVCSGGDFLCVEKAPVHYANRYIIPLSGKEVYIHADVKLIPEVLTEYSRNHGGFALTGQIVFEDGTTETIDTDNTWNSRISTEYVDFQKFKTEKEENEWEKPLILEDIWNAQEAPIPNLHFENVFEKEIKVSGKYSETFELDRIYGAYPVISSTGKVTVKISTSELPGQETMEEEATFGKEGTYRSFRMHSVGTITIDIDSSEEITVKVALLATWFPIDRQGKFICSDEGFNKVMDVCLHTLKICRQTIHLDSTKHQELLACTGDYNIETLISLYAFGDMRLSELDVIRTADWLVMNKGRMFHTTYSLIWVQMLHTVYMVTGNKELLFKCKDAIKALFDLFETYIGETGTIENPPDYMFVDWTTVDGYNMHHPPRVLGQTVLNAFYYEALNKASAIYGYMGMKNEQKAFKSKAAALYDAFNYYFWNEDMQLFFDGLPGKAEYNPDWGYENPDKTYITKYSNILACLYGLVDEETGAEILDRIVFEENLQDIQPYFMHYMIGAVRRCGRFDKYGMKLLSRWKEVADECSKGLKEGWIAPHPTYSFDHSHAWGGSVAYQLPSVISGMKILKPGMTELEFSPNLWGLESADISIPVFCGEISLKLRNGQKPIINVPKEIKYTVKEVK